MKVKNVIDEYGKKVQIDEDSKKLYDYNNKLKKITYNAEIIENGKPSGSWTNYEEDGVVEDIEERLQTWNNRVKLEYAAEVKFNALKNDPDGKIWEKFLKYVSSHENYFFDEYGDLRKDFVIDPEKIFNK